MYAMLLLLAGSLLVEAYVTIKPALHVAAVSMAAVMVFVACLKEEYRQPIFWRAMIAAAVMPIIAWSLTNIWLLFAFVGIGLPLIARTRETIVSMYLFSLLLLPALDTPTIVGPLKLFDFSVHDALAVGATIGILRCKDRASPSIHCDAAVCIILLILGMALARGTSISHFMRESLNVIIDLGLPYFIVSRGLRSMRDMRLAMMWMAAGAVTLSAILAYEVVKNWAIYSELYRNYDLPTQFLIKERAGQLRAGGPFVEPTSAAMVLGQCALALWLSRSVFRSKISHLLLFAFTLYGLSAPQSRGAWIGLFVALMAADTFRGKYSRLFEKAVIIGLACGGLFLAAHFSTEVAQSIGLAGDSSDTSDYRRRLLARGMEEFWKNPVMGYSTPQLLIQMHDLRQGEGIVDFVNTYLWIALISGIGGLLIFIRTFFFFMYEMWKSVRIGAGVEGGREAATFVFAALCMVMEMLFFTSFGTRPAIYLFALFGFGAAYVGVCRRFSADAVQEWPDMVVPTCEQLV